MHLVVAQHVDGDQDDVAAGTSGLEGGAGSPTQEEERDDEHSPHALTRAQYARKSRGTGAEYEIIRPLPGCASSMRKAWSMSRGACGAPASLSNSTSPATGWPIRARWAR